MFQFDAGTWADTLATYGDAILTTSGNTAQAVSFVVDQVTRDVPGVTGWLEPPEPRRFADRVREALSGGALAGMRKPARARAEEFGWDRFVARMDDVMEQVAAAHD